jgi:hypothetical protein
MLRGDGHDGRDGEADGGLRRRSVLRAAGTAAAVGTGVGLGSGSAVAASTTVPDDYATVQAAVDNATSDGVDEVVVTEGTYAGTLTVDVPDLTVRTSGPKAATVEGSDEEAGAAVSIAADGVTFEGFAVRNPGNLLGVKIQPGNDGVTVRNSHVSDVGPVGRLGATGIVGGGAHDDLTVEGNLVERVSNEIDEDSNFPTVNGILVDDEGGGSLTNSRIADNEVRDLTSDVASIGIILGIDAEHVTVEGNAVHGLSADPANDSDDSDDSFDYVDTFAQGLNVSRGTTDVSFRRNVVRDVTATYFVGTGLKIDGQADGLTVELNDLLPTVGVENADAEAVSATCNYWGHPKGPREVEENRDADDGPNRQGRSAVVGPADVSSWLVRSVDNGENVENSCVGGDGKGDGNGNGNGNGRGGGPPN